MDGTEFPKFWTTVRIRPGVPIVGELVKPPLKVTDIDVIQAIRKVTNIIYALIVQLVEYFFGKEEVTGSIPVKSTINRSIKIIR